MANIDKAFRTENLSVDDLTLITSQAADPTIGPGYEAPIGSLLLRTNGSVYRKVGTADVDWQELDGVNAEEIFALMKEPTGYVDRGTSEISFVNATRTFTIQPLAPATEFVYYIRGERVVINTSKSIVIPDVSGVYFIYFDTAQNLNVTNLFTAELLTSFAYTTVLYWNATAGEATYFADERHGITMDGETHLHFHTAIGTQYINGFALSSILSEEDGSLDTHMQCEVGDGILRDEDVQHDIYNTGGAVNTFDLEQALSPIAQIPVMYRLGAGAEWTLKPADNFPLIYSDGVTFTGAANGLAAWNEFTGGAWQLTELGNNRYVLVHILATNDVNNPIVAIQGITEYQNKPAGRDAARLELNQLSGLPFEEFLPIGTLIVEARTAYTNAPKARIRSTDDGADYIDWRAISQFSVNNVGSGINDHGNLGGLGDDDHTQYALAGSGSTRTFDIADLTDVVVTTPTTNDVLQLNASGDWVNVQLAAATDELAKVSANDTTAGYLNGKLLSGTGVTLTENNDGANETLTLTVNQGEIDHTNILNVGTNTHAQIDTHIGDATIHFTEASIDHTAITNIGTNTHAQIDTHIADGTVHFTEASIDHTAITNIGTNTHAQIDTHIADTTNPHSTAVSNLNEVVLTALANGEVLQYNGTNWVNVALAAATDELVKISATDTTAGYLGAKLVAGTNITFTTLGAGANEQIQIDAAGGATGETNTASNIGTAGVGVFDGKVGVDLQFRNINAGSNKITIADDTANNEIDVDVVEGNIVHQNLSGAGTNTHAQIDTHIGNTTIHFTEASIDHTNILNVGTNTHAQIDTHIADTNNPHNTTIANLDDTNVVTPGDNWSLRYDSTAGEWVAVPDTPPPPVNSTGLVQLFWGPIPAQSGTVTIPNGGATPPSITQGVPIVTQAITPTATTSTIRVACNATISASTAALEFVFAVFRGSTCVGTAVNSTSNKDSGFSITFEIYDTPATTAEITYQIRVGKSSGGGTWYVNEIAGETGAYGGTLTSNSYSVEEIGVSV
jgi:hypothetical protein